MKHNEKKTPHYSLELIKELILQRKYLIRKIAIENAMCDFDLNPKELLKYVLKIENIHFKKRSFADKIQNFKWLQRYSC